MTNKTDSELNDLLDLLSPAVPGDSNTSKKEPLTYISSQRSLVQIQYRPPYQQFT